MTSWLVCLLDFVLVGLFLVLSGLRSVDFEKNLGCGGINLQDLDWLGFLLFICLFYGFCFGR